MKVVLLCWRDTGHPQGGGSERYLEHVADYLVAHGHTVTFCTARYTGSTKTTVRRGVRFRRAGNRFTVYPHALAWLLLHRRAVDVVVDTHNGIPFFAKLVTRAPVVVLTHHCHRELWPVAGRILGRIGWWLESRIAPRIYRNNQWVTVSTPSAQELQQLGLKPDQISIIRNGLDPQPNNLPTLPKTDTPHLITLSRLVPHKQIEHAMNILAHQPEIHLDIVGSGWWEQPLRAHAEQLNITQRVHFHGQVGEELKHALLQRAAIHLMPSAKEGWGLAVMEAAAHGVPTVGYQHSAGLKDSVIDGETGLLVENFEQLVQATTTLINNPQLRTTLGENARRRSAQFSWEDTGAQFERLLQQITAK